MSVTLNGEARARLDKHLDAVEAALVAAGNSREQRRGALDDLEAQILDMLQARSQTPTLENVEAVLAKLDPPAAYEESADGTVTPVGPAPLQSSARYSRAALVGLMSILLSLPFLISVLFHPADDAKKVSYSAFMTALHEKRLQMVVIKETGDTFVLTGTLEQLSGRIVAKIPASALDGEAFSELERRAKESGADLKQVPSEGLGGRIIEGLSVALAILWVFLVLGGTILGWIAFFQIRAAKGSLRGKGLALFNGLFYPIVTLLLIPLLSVQ